jgi:hypothetical protein
MKNEAYEALTRLTGKQEKLCKNGCNFWLVSNVVVWNVNRNVSIVICYVSD